MKRENIYRPCPICGCIKVRLFLPSTSAIPTLSSQIQVTDKYFGLHGDIVKCQRCEFAYVGRDPYVKKVVGLYKNMSDQIYMQEERERRLSFISVIKTIEKLKGDKKGKILDIGCCTGGLLSEAQNRGWEVYGVDPSTWACEIAQKRHDLKIYNGIIEDYKPKVESFDAITILDVLEHVENPAQLLIKIHKLLSYDGVFTIVTPDFGSLTARLLGKKWWGIRLAHLSYFRTKDLDRLIKSSGFKIIKRKTYVRYFSLYYILVRLFPVIERMQVIKAVLKKIVIPLIFFDTFEIYLVKK